MFRITEVPSSGSLVQYCPRAVPSYTMKGIICCHNTDHIHANVHVRTILVILAKYCTRLPDDGSSVIRNMLVVCSATK